MMILPIETSGDEIQERKIPDENKERTGFIPLGKE